MARRRSSGTADLVLDVVTIGALAGGGYWGYNEALNGKLGPDAQRAALQFKAWLDQLLQIGLPHGENCIRAGVEVSPRMCQLIRLYPGVYETMQSWQQGQGGMTSCDWSAFKAYYQSAEGKNLGDPEPVEFSAFCWGGGSY